MEKILDSTQLVSGVAVLLSFLAGYRYGMRNFDEQTKSTEKDSTDKERVNFFKAANCISSRYLMVNCFFFGSIGIFGQ